jgi:hypothetical protein
MKRKPAKNRLTLSQTDLSVSFYDMAADHPRESFELIAKPVVPKGFGKPKSSAAFKREARRMFDLART